ncbi:hypothetical protein P691DRAFT_726586 [Macrolepiota fuliginosa MF-IS2]|uniref:Uncharacterized protein n=1 Tax=Macrolepiota fuliginosa MF-IS2 TaxID=1400762 RepID=A0A9P6C3J9_9AGAR|nr:hypothetical protein P691DRAFT_726586 [Macrolepiota fuliginosa MF-IS2]
MMASPSHVEQDNKRPSGGGELPTYDDLVEQNGPNSRFGRWRGWIEKRAAERYHDITPEERERRRERGWDLEPGPRVPPKDILPPIITNQPPTPGVLPELHIQTSTLSLQDDPFLEQEQPQKAASPPPLSFVSQSVEPSHLKLNTFGSRFLPHATSQIRCILPLNSERLLLIGHDEGLSVLDCFPQEWTATGGIDVKNPDEAHARLIWEGEGVFQMTVIEQGEGLDGKIQGVILALVGPEPGSPYPKDGDTARSLRMYNLLSITNLAKWAIAHRGARPLDLRRPPNWQAQTTPVKKHRPQGSIARGFKSLIEMPSPHTSPEQQYPVSYHNMLNTGVPNESPERRINTPLTNPQQLPILAPSRRNTDDSSWDVIDDVPLRWATDFVPLASPGSRLAGLSVISYALWVDENRIGRGGQLLAVSTRANILLYEVPKGERAFRFVKEFYTPMQPRNISFFQQTVQEVTRSVSDITGSGSGGRHKRADSTNTIRYDGFSRSPPATAMPSIINYGPQLSLFVIFDKKAGWIRIADSAVGEMELPDDSYVSALNQNQGGGFLSARDTLSATVAAGSHRVRARLSFEHAAPPKWILPARCELPIPAPTNSLETTRKVIFLTRGRKTHILPSPLPTNYATYPSLAIITWRSPPRHVTPRVCEPDNSNEPGDLPPFLQLVAFGEEGLEVQEMSLNFISRGKGKGKATYEEVVRAEDDVIGDCGYLAMGGHWDQVSRLMDPAGLERSNSSSSEMSSASYDSVGTSVIMSRLKREEGIYGWWKKGSGDFRVFWVGGSASDMD